MTKTEFNDHPNAALLLAPFLIEMARYLAADADTLRAMGMDPGKPLAPDILPRALLITMLDTAQAVLPRATAVAWLRQSATAIEDLASGPKHNI
jgi:hypothetical protein